MSRIKIIIEQPDEGTSISMHIPDDVPVNMVIMNLIAELGLPIIQNSVLLSYRLEDIHTGQSICDTETLHSAGILPNARLCLRVRTQAAPFISELHATHVKHSFQFLQKSILKTSTRPLIATGLVDRLLINPTPSAGRTAPQQISPPVSLMLQSDPAQSANSNSTIAQKIPTLVAAPAPQVGLTQPQGVVPVRVNKTPRWITFWGIGITILVIMITVSITSGFFGNGNAPAPQVSPVVAQTRANDSPATLAPQESTPTLPLNSARNDANQTATALSEAKAIAEKTAIGEQSTTATAIANATATPLAILASSWRSYDQAVAQQDWESAIRVLDTIIGITGATPRDADYSGSSYDPRIPDVANLRAQARLTYAGQLQLKGKLDAAKAQYEAVISEEGVKDELKQQSKTKLGSLAQAVMLWEAINQGWTAKQWVAVIKALEGLRDLEGFGPKAQDIGSDNSVEKLIQMAITERDRPAPTKIAAPVKPAKPAQPQPPVPTEPMSPNE